MAGILGLGSSGSAGLNQELIDKLKEAERKARVEPIEAKLEKWDTELEKFGEIEQKVNGLLSAISVFDLYNTKGTNAFEQIVANTSGTSAMFEAVDASLLSPGMTTIEVTQLAKRDVFQTDTFSDKTALVSENVDHKISIAIGTGDAIEFSLNQSYEDLAKEINSKTGLSANIEKVGDNEYRIIVKSTDSGLANKLTISGDSNLLGLDDPANYVQEAKNMQATIDGVNYNVSSNTITIQGGLSVTAVALGSSSINIEKDNTAIAPAMQNFIDKYNELVELVDSELYSKDSALNDTSSIRMILSTIKNTMFNGYGSSGELSLFNYGFGLDEKGKMSLDSQKFGEAVLNNLDDLKELFIGVPETKGLGTTLKETLDDMKLTNGLLRLYGDNMTARKETLEKDKTTAIEQLDAKYFQLAQQFAAYTAIISQMESAFGGLKMMIEQSTAK
ncbi:flagellar filament capping protein FliD [Arcobacter sp. FWKO B]|uniref:flagellar filament capping protein FliD n=1 Tax=Arcobacter sp. FWKO B TaxID=2593672 RepID=UPI0018A4B167|nr:flagellar filament capping protein FliD [Arcobacter sp. FWKO B]QOG12390.1 flagellar hook protein FliD [Arcobacter sp. FWKO B]